MICVDASVAVKWVINEDHADTATALHDDVVLAGEPIVAPSLLPFEITNILWQRVRRQILTRGQAEDALARFLAFRVTLVSPVNIHRDAFALTSAHVLPAAYDAHYLAVAQQLSISLWTDDQRLLNTLGGRLPFVRSLRSYRGEKA